MPNITKKKSNSPKDLRIFFLSVSIFTIILLTLFLSSFYKKSLNLETNSLSDISLNIREGQYTLDIEYSSQQDTALYAKATTNEQDYFIWSYPLSAANNGSISIPFNMGFSVLNDGLHFITNEGTEISSFSINRTDFPIKEFLCLIFYIVTITLSFFISVKSKSDIPILGLSIYSGCFILLWPIFITNISVLLITFILTILFYFLNLKTNFKKICQNENIFIFTSFLALSLLAMLFFTTSSPLFPFNLWTDENIYYAIGKGIFHGKQLYTEMFDHKGPCFFFLYMLGYMISPNKYYGVYLIESALLSLSLFCIYKIAFSATLKKNTSLFVSVFMLPFLLNSGYIGKGGSFEQMSVSALLATFLLILPYYQDSYQTEKMHLDSWRFILLGFIFSFVFFSKFNISFTWLFVVIPVFFMFIMNKQYFDLIKSILYYIAGIMINIAIIFIYFKGKITTLIDYYIIFNGKYGRITSISHSIKKIIQRVYAEFNNYPIVFILILLGVSCIIYANTTRINSYGKIALISSFIVLVGTTYPGKSSFPYYYSVIASYSLWGAIAIAYFIEKNILKYDLSLKNILTAGIFFFGLTFLYNDLILESIIINKEPYPQDIFNAQMLMYSPTDTSFFECGMMEWGFVSQSKADPCVQYFFYPNIDQSSAPEVFNGQLEYIQNQETEFIITYGFDIDSPPEIPYLNDYYHEISRIQYHDNTGESFWLYQRNH